MPKSLKQQLDSKTAKVLSNAKALVKKKEQVQSAIKKKEESKEE